MTGHRLPTTGQKGKCAANPLRACTSSFKLGCRWKSIMWELICDLGRILLLTGCVTWGRSLVCLGLSGHIWLVKPKGLADLKHPSRPSVLWSLFSWWLLLFYVMRLFLDSKKKKKLRDQSLKKYLELHLFLVCIWKVLGSSGERSAFFLGRPSVAKTTGQGQSSQETEVFVIGWHPIKPHNVYGCG